MSEKQSLMKLRKNNSIKNKVNAKPKIYVISLFQFVSFKFKV